MASLTTGDTTHESTVPVLLLKTKSTPGDAYQELLSTPQNDGQVHFAPRFVPVLLHKFEDAGMSQVAKLLVEKKISKESDAAYGGLIFTSQRAVEAFTKLVEDGSKETDDKNWPHLQNIPIYSVGPATTRAINAIPSPHPLEALGSHTGNGEALASFILDDYPQRISKSDPQQPNPPLLFLVGEQRRDIIPKTLTAPDLPMEKHIPVDEVVVYGTGEMPSFPDDFTSALKETQSHSRRWIVVFSPTGCDSMLRGLGMLDEQTRKAKTDDRDGKTFIATIGPTTRRYLVNTFGFEPDVCAETPTPEGVIKGILDLNARTS